MSYDEPQLLENGVSWLQVKCFVDAVVHIGTRLLDYIVENFPPLRDSCGEQLSSAVQVSRSWCAGFRTKEYLRPLDPVESLTLLQALACAPCLLCGHEVPPSMLPDTIKEGGTANGTLVYMKHIIPNRPSNPGVPIVNYVEELLLSADMAQHCKLTPSDSNRSVLLQTNDGEPLPASTLQVLSQARQGGDSELQRNDAVACGDATAEGPGVQDTPRWCLLSTALQGQAVPGYVSITPCPASVWECCEVCSG